MTAPATPQAAPATDLPAPAADVAAPAVPQAVTDLAAPAVPQAVTDLAVPAAPRTAPVTDLAVPAAPQAAPATDLPAPAAPQAAPAQPAAVPRFAAPAHSEQSTGRGTAVAVRRAGTGHLTEARLLFPLTPASGAHQSRVEVMAEALRDALTEAAADLATVRVEARSDRAVIAVRTFADDFAATRARIRDCLDASRPHEARRVREAAGRVARRLAAAEAAPAFLARSGFLAAAYGPHPYGRAASAAETAGVDPAHTTALLHGTGAARRRSIVVGPGPAQELLAQAAALLPRTTTAPHDAPDGPFQPPAPAPGPRRTVLHPATPQTLLRLGALVPGRGHDDYPALQLAALMLGGYYASRLTLVLREREGLAYAPRAVLDPLGAHAVLTVEADVRHDGAARALTLIAQETQRLADGAFTARELRNAQNYAVGSMAMACSSRSGLASTYAAVLASGLPASWPAGYEDRLRALTAHDVARAAATHLATPALTGVVVAPAPMPGLPPTAPHGT
ncbi:insulinase family protein [Streptomyces sp. NPDC005236]|uniref:M16 family metallopeptidase n=1 Tax=Streptomyces sp. NPDC005236 TaxID=3157028 RepID=UPI0033BD1A65